MPAAIRSAGPGDAAAIAAVHAASWRSAYRGIFSDAYLDHDADAERLRHWEARLRTEPRPDQGIFLALEEGACVGFICVFLEAEPAWGPLLDNLHVRPGRTNQGLGRELIAAGQAWIKAQGPFSRWHLWVLEGNGPARRVYEHLGWRPAERARHHAPDGTEYESWRYVQDL